MALKIRRGTEAERAALTGANPALAEPIFVTDTGKLWIGDGVTTGGIEINPDINLNDLEDVSVAAPAAGQILTWSTLNSQWEAQTLNVAQEINDLTDVDTTGFANGKVLKYDSTSHGGSGGWVVGDEAFLSFDLDAQLASRSIDNLGDVDVSTNSPLDGQVLTYDAGTSQFIPQDPAAGTLNGNFTGTFTGVFDGDINGSVFGDDSTTILDGINKTLTINSIAFVDSGQIDVPNNILAINGNLASQTTVLTQYAPDAGHTQKVWAIIDGTDGPGMYINASRGTLETPASTVVGDLVKNDLVFAHTGTDFKVASMTSTLIDPDGTITATTVPGMQVIGTFNDGDVENPLGIVIRHDGSVTINRGLTSAQATLDVNGTMLLEKLSAEPTVAEGMFAVADGINWDPAVKNGAVPYPVFYDGNTWNALY